MIKRLKSKRVYLRELTIFDATQEYRSWLNDSEANEYLETHSATISGLKKYIKLQRDNPNSLFLGIFDKRTNVHIGNIKLEPIDWLKRTATLGILIGDKNYWGKGYAPEALKLLTDWAFKKLHIGEVNLGVISENQRALKAYKKAGFRIIGLRKRKTKSDHRSDEVLMSIKNRRIKNRFRASIIIRAYNNQETINAAMRSALEQDFPQDKFEIIVINDGSTDKTRMRLGKYEDFDNVLVFDQENKGAVESANIGFRIACGKYETLLDADDLLDKKFLSEMTGVLDNKPGADFAYCDYFEQSGKALKTVSPGNIFETVADGILFRKNKMEAENFYRLDLFFAEYDLLLRTFGRWSYKYYPKALFTYFRRPGSLTSNRIRVEQGLRELRKLHPNKLAQIDKIRPYFSNDPISFRRANPKDLMFYLKLRNEPSVRKTAFNEKAVDLFSHRQWFLSKLNSPSSHLLVVKAGGEKIGQIRLDVEGKHGEVDVAIVPSFQGMGYGSKAMAMACLEFFRTIPGLNVIMAHIKVDNITSLKSFAKAGFKKKGPVDYKNHRCLEMVIEKGRNKLR